MRTLEAFLTPGKSPPARAQGRAQSQALLQTAAWAERGQGDTQPLHTLQLSSVQLLSHV